MHGTQTDGPDDPYAFVHPVSGRAMCMDVRDFSTTPGGVVQQYRCAWTANQLWNVHATYHRSLPPVQRCAPWLCP